MKQTAGTVAALVATVAVALLGAACGNGSAASTGSGAVPDAPGSTGSPSAVAYSACMRAHGVPNFPDPVSGGQVPKADPQQLGVSTDRLQAARDACKQLIPGSGSTDEQQEETQCAMAGDCSQAVVQKWLSGLRTMAQCLRTHGVPNWPDPVVDSHGLPHYPYDQAGIDHHSSAILSKVQACVDLTGFQGLPLP
jgi:hypothetical protein